MNYRWDRFMDRHGGMVLFGLLVVASLAFYFGYGLLRPCTETGPGTCPVYCTGVDHEGDFETYICDTEPCVVCTEREWFWVE